MATKLTNPMTGSWTKATKAVRRLKSGRPIRNIGREQLTPLQVVCRLFAEVEKAYGVLRDELISTDDLSWALQYYVPASTSHPAYVTYREQTTRGFSGGPKTRLETSTDDAIQLLKELNELPGVVFLGIEWSLTDREDVDRDAGFVDDPMNKGIPMVASWQTPFNSYMHMRAEAITEAFEGERETQK